jgi:hypothetical protein
LAQGLRPLLEFKVTKIFLDDHRHGHAQRRGEVLHSHFPLPVAIRKQMDQATRQIVRISRPIKFNCQLLAIGHLAEVWNVRADDRHAIGASQMRNPAAARRR